MALRSLAARAQERETEVPVVGLRKGFLEVVGCTDISTRWVRFELVIEQRRFYQGS